MESRAYTYGCVLRGACVVGLFLTGLLVGGGCATTRNELPSEGEAASIGEASPEFPPPVVPFFPDFLAPEVMPPYEPWPVFPVAAGAPEALLDSPYYSLAPQAYNDGRFNHYLMNSDFGQFLAVGNEMLAIRAHELYTVAVLRRMKDGKAFGRGMGAGVKDLVTGPFRAIGGIFRNPLNAVKVLPKQAVQAVGLVAGTVKVVGTGFDKELVKDWMGYVEARNELATKLEVDPNTSNPVLQQELNEVAWRYFAGGVPIRVADAFIPGVPIPGLSLWGGGVSLGKISRAIRPGSANRKMRRMGVHRDLRKALTEHTHLTSRHLDEIAEHLFAMKDVAGRDAFFLAAALADSEVASRTYAREALLLRRYHETVAPITEIVAEGYWACARDETGRVVIPVYADHIVWTPALEARLDTLRSASCASTLPEEVLWTQGTVSPQTCRMLTAWGMDAWEGVGIASPD